MRTKTVQGLGANTWKEIAIEATMEAHSNAPYKLRDTIDKYILDNSQDPEDKKGSKRRHASAIAASALFEDRLLRDSSC